MLEPKHWHHFITLSLMGGGFAVGHTLPSTWDVIFLGGGMMWFGVVFGTMTEFKMYEDYRRWQRIDESPRVEKVTQENKPQVTPRLVNVPNFNQTIKQVVFDMERQYAKTLLIMRDYKPNCEAVDLRESYWVKPNKFRSRDEYLVVRNKWEAHSVIRKSAARKNAPYIVGDWYKVERIAGGTKLPPLPQA